MKKVAFPVMSGDEDSKLYEMKYKSINFIKDNRIHRI